MRLTAILRKQHIGRMFKKHWIVQGQRVPVETNAQQTLENLGFKVEDALEVIAEPRKEFK